MTKKIVLTATRHGHYVNKKGNVVFRYLVNGDKEALEAYEEAQGSNFRAYEGEAGDKLNGTPLFFSTRALPKAIDLEIGAKGVYVAEDTDIVAEKVLDSEQQIQSEINKLKALKRWNAMQVGQQGAQS